MRKLYLGSVLLLMVAAGTLLALGCGEDVTDSNGKSVSSLAISPSSATVEVGSTQVFSSTATYSDGSTGNPVASWSVTGEIGTVQAIGLNGLFTATATGSGTVAVEYGGQSASAAASVISTGEVTGEAELATIEVSPAGATIKVGKSQMFSASGTNTSAESMAISPIWSYTGDAIGVLSYDGAWASFEATAEGTAVINAVSGEVTGSANITVEGYVTTITAEADTYVSSPESGAHGSDIDLKAGRISDPSVEIYQTYISFEVSFIPAGSTIEVATLRLYCSDTDGSTVKLGRLSSVWSGSTTWGSKPTIGSFVTSHAFSSGANSIDIKDLVQYWIDTANYGLALYKESPSTGYVDLVSVDDTSVEGRRPKLYLEYLTP